MEQLQTRIPLQPLLSYITHLSIRVNCYRNPSAIPNKINLSPSNMKSFGNKDQYANNCFKRAERSW
ncbi:hypothetical protein HanXRQr2_Chr06g0257301 [Helianthus annuus]|uniref:Uncharacterized protein n=1 Tax=Helianthus annuus TaxID=4232 RepID=A0A9K3ISU6_HELAN|nr:hypothetical protein HanXRQr2_Chr06g0257301 [Helianthus annuus]KAJ0915298.1 hypothetical protein HanPSC8_Chr06g0248291 [Helianthus annuus]